MSLREALSSPITRASAARLTLRVDPSRALMVSVLPSTASIWPRTRTGGDCWAKAVVMAPASTRPASASRGSPVMVNLLSRISPLSAGHEENPGPGRLFLTGSRLAALEQIVLDQLPQLRRDLRADAEPQM